MSATNASETIAPYLDVPRTQVATPHSLFRPVRSFGVGGSLIQKFVEVQLQENDIFSHFRAPPEQTRMGILDATIHQRVRPY